MAEVTTPKRASVLNEPIKKKIFGNQKAADVIIYRLDKRNDKVRDDTPPYPPYIRFPNYDIITWEDEETGVVGTRAIRWLPGETTIFVDEQEKNGRTIPENILNNPNNRFEIIDGEIKVRPHEKTKIQFLDYCNRNSRSEYSTGRVQGIFSRYSEEGQVENLKNKQKLQKEALDKAYAASPEQIAFHAKYLNIPMVDPKTSATRTQDAVSTDYVQFALDNPSEFIKTYDDEDLKLKYKIEKAIEENFINLDIIKGKAVYTGNKQEICDVPQVKEISVIVDTLFIFASGKNGGDFLKKISDYGK
jgi:hypothetical protein